MDSVKETVNILLSCGAADVGFCRFEGLKDMLIPCRAINRLPKNANTVIVALFPYKVKEAPPKNICRYAAVPDYHVVCGNMLEAAANRLKEIYPDNSFQAFIDNSPLPEVVAAAKAGLGVIGKNGLLITEQYGSYVFLGEIVTDLQFEFEEAQIEACLGCGRCRTACPVALDKENCLSKITQQKKELSAKQAQLISEHGCVWGCDICATVCPMNHKAQTTYIKEFTQGYRDCYTAGEDIQGRAYAWRGEGVILRNAQLLKTKK